MPLEEWTRKEADGTLPSGDYVVTAIVAERTRPGGRARQFLVKWKVSAFCQSSAHALLPSLQAA